MEQDVIRIVVGMVGMFISGFVFCLAFIKN
jgi:hypothetical protein